VHNRGTGRRQYGRRPAEAGFLEGLRQIATENGIVLIFDEVITGFRVFTAARRLLRRAAGPDDYGKIIGGGLPMGAYGGKREIMEFVAPSDQSTRPGRSPAIHSAVAAGLETLKMLREAGVYETWRQRARCSPMGCWMPAKSAGVEAIGTESARCLPCSSRPSRWSITLRRSRRMRPVMRVLPGDASERVLLRHRPQFEAAFVSTAHTNNDISDTIEAARETLLVLALS